MIVGLTTFLQNLSFPMAFFISLLSWSLQIPVDHGGLSTLKNHFFHTGNSLTCLISMCVYHQHWEAKKLVVPFRYCLSYAMLQFLLQSSGKTSDWPEGCAILWLQDSLPSTPSWTSRTIWVWLWWLLWYLPSSYPPSTWPSAGCQLAFTISLWKQRSSNNFLSQSRWIQ